MWNKLVFGSLAAAMITACGPAVSEDGAKSTEIKPTPKSVVEDNPADMIIRIQLSGGDKITGWLPEAVDPDVSNFQDRLIEALDRGVREEVFANLPSGIRPPSESIIRNGEGVILNPSGPKSVEGRYKMYLVKEAVSRVPEVKGMPCSVSGNLYLATIAVKPYLSYIPASTHSVNNIVQGYKVHICDTAKGMDYTIVP